MSDAALVQREDSVGVQLVRLAIERGSDVETLERLYALQRQAQMDDAEAQFNAAMNRCQSKLSRISADMVNPQTKSKYASYQQIDRAIRPVYTEEGISLSFSDAEVLTPGMVNIVCHVSRGMYTRIYRKSMPVVTEGAKGNAMMTPTHAHGSADSYAKRYLVKDIFNLAIGEDDDDGNNLAPAQLALVKDISEANTLEELERTYKDAAKTAMASGNQTALKAYVDAKDRRKAELSESA